MVCGEALGESVIPALPHVLNLCHGDLPAPVSDVQLLHFPAHARNRALAYLLHNLAIIGQIKPNLEPCEAAGQFGNLCFLEIERNTKFVTDAFDSIKAVLKVFTVWVQQVAVIHVSAISADPADLLDVMVEAVCRGQRKHLRYLASQPHADVTESIN